MAALYQIFDYPDAEENNSKLYDIVCQNLDHKVQGDGHITLMDLHSKKIKEIDSLLNWMKTVMCRAAYEFSSSGNDSGESMGFGINAFKICECWGIHYNKGERVIKHNHFPYTLSFGYCVRSDDNSSPFIIEGERISSVPGRAVVFLAHQQHGTDLNESDERCMIVGNALYTPHELIRALAF